MKTRFQQTEYEKTIIQNHLDRALFELNELQIKLEQYEIFMNKLQNSKFNKIYQCLADIQKNDFNLFTCSQKND